MNNTQLFIALVTAMVVLFGCTAYIDGTNMRTIVETCKEAK